MSLRMTYVTKRDNSSYFQFRMRVPQDVLDQVRGRQIPILLPAFREDPALAVTTKIGTEIKFSLRTHDEAVAKVRDAAARTYLEKVFDAARSRPKPLSHRQLVPLSDEVYRKYVETFEDEPILLTSSETSRLNQTRPDGTRPSRFRSISSCSSRRAERARRFRRAPGLFARGVLTRSTPLQPCAGGRSASSRGWRRGRAARCRIPQGFRRTMRDRRREGPIARASAARSHPS